MRRASEDEKTLFRKMVEHSRPQVISRAKGKKPAAKKSVAALDGHTAKRLQRGAQIPEAKLDLHGLTQEAAHRALLSFLLRGRKKGARLALVITGQSGVLKEMAPRWLKEKDFAAVISGTAPAHVRHGGGGALYVYLRKPE